MSILPEQRGDVMSLNAIESGLAAVHGHLSMHREGEDIYPALYDDWHSVFDATAGPDGTYEVSDDMIAVRTPGNAMLYSRRTKGSVTVHEDEGNIVVSLNEPEHENDRHTVKAQRTHVLELPLEGVSSLTTQTVAGVAADSRDGYYSYEPPLEVSYMMTSRIAQRLDEALKGIFPANAELQGQRKAGLLRRLMGRIFGSV